MAKRRTIFADMTKHTQDTDLELKLRLAQLRAKWPKSIKYVELYLEKYFPKADEETIAKEKTHLYDVWNLKKSDKQITDRFESLFETHLENFAK